ncbi:hypothetical protein ACJX0J_012200, partial [Zea mays]
KGAISGFSDRSCAKVEKAIMAIWIYGDGIFHEDQKIQYTLKRSKFLHLSTAIVEKIHIFFILASIQFVSIIKLNIEIHIFLTITLILVVLEITISILELNEFGHPTGVVSFNHVNVC